MKIIVLFLCLSFSVNTNAQLTAVPDTETFTLQDVYDVITYWADYYGNYPTPDLQSCFDQANLLSPSFFDSNYSGYAANSLLRFRNYQGTGACTRPSGLNTYQFFKKIYKGGVFYDIGNTGSDACDVVYRYLNGDLVGGTLVTYPQQSSGLTVGTRMYNTDTLTDCSSPVDGWYVLSTGFDYCGPIYHIEGGFITEIYSCPC